LGFNITPTYKTGPFAEIRIQKPSFTIELNKKKKKKIRMGIPLPGTTNQRLSLIVGKTKVNE